MAFEIKIRIFTIRLSQKGFNMNRKKKINSILKKRMKKINAKAAPANKSQYISKAEREKIAAQANLEMGENEAIVSE